MCVPALSLYSEEVVDGGSPAPLNSWVLCDLPALLCPPLPQAPFVITMSHVQGMGSLMRGALSQVLSVPRRPGGLLGMRRASAGQGEPHTRCPVYSHILLTYYCMINGTIPLHDFVLEEIYRLSWWLKRL